MIITIPSLEDQNMYVKLLNENEQKIFNTQRIINQLLKEQDNLRSNYFPTLI